MGRLTSNQEYSRSISVPGDRTGTTARSERGSHFPRMASSPEEKSVDLFPVCESSIPEFRNNFKGPHNQLEPDELGNLRK